MWRQVLVHFQVTAMYMKVISKYVYVHVTMYICFICLICYV